MLMIEMQVILLLALSLFKFGEGQNSYVGYVCVSARCRNRIDGHRRRHGSSCYYAMSCCYITVTELDTSSPTPTIPVDRL
jgi:hypothetical protein